MSFSETDKKRHVIQKLDFENCIVTNIKTTTRGRKKLRARITREIEEVSDNSKGKQHCEKSASTSQTSQPSSPVLIKKQNKKIGSPVFLKRKKINFSEESIGKDWATEEIPPSPGSPVFKTFKKPKTDNSSLNSCQESQKVFGKTTRLDMFNSQESSKSGLQSSLHIDEFTQESKASIQISSVESRSIKNESCDIISFESNAVSSSSSHQYSPLEMTDRFHSQDEPESPRLVRKNYNKNSLLGRLLKLQQKQASEKLLRRHQNRINSSESLKVSVINFWKEEFNYFLKCQSCFPDFELVFLIVDSRWVPNVKKITEGSVILLHPPWQKLLVKESVMTVLLNIICLDVLNETREFVLPKRSYESIPAIRYETDQNLFVDSLFSSCDSGFF